MKLRFLLSLTALAAAQPAAAQSNHSQLFFDASGSDQAAYAGNQIITISGNLTYYGRRDPQPSGPGASLDFVQPASDVYVVPNGWWKGGQADGLPLEDVSNAPNTILGAGSGGFFEEPIATTHPQGSLVSGDYDVVFDEHQDGAWQSALDLYAGSPGAPAISVRVDANAPSLPGAGIAAMKLKATRQYEAAVPLQGAWVGIQNIMNPQARLLEAVTKLGEGTAQPGDFSLNYAEILEGPVMMFYATFIYMRNQLLPQFKQADDFMAMPFSAATAAIENKMKRAVGLAADPPDPNFAMPVVLAPRRAPNATNMDPLARAMAAAGAATEEEQRLSAGLLAALEKYQGAAAGLDPCWALFHARAAQRFATLLEAQTARAAPVLSALRAQLASYPVNLDAVANVLAGRQAVVRTSGWPAEVKLALAAVGASGAEMEKAAADFSAMSFGFSSARALADLDTAIAAASGSTGYADLATSLDATITTLLAEPSLDKGDPVIATAPAFSGTARTALALAATGSDPLGREVTFDWDLDGDGAFDDAQGAAIAHTWPAAFSAHVGVQITNAAGRTAHAWAHVTIADTNRTPVFASLSPRKAFVESETGTTLTFHAEASDPDAQPVTIQWLLDNEPVGTGNDYTFTPSAAQAGMRALVAKATDGQGGETTHVWLLALKKPGVALADLSVTMEAPVAPVLTGAEFTWTMTVENHGPTAAANVMLTQFLPSGLTFVRSSTSFGNSSHSGGVVTANFGTVAAGGTATLWVQTTAASAGFGQSSVSVSSTAADSTTANNSASASVRVNAPTPTPQSADVSLAAAVAPSPATVGGTQTITFTTANAGPDGASGLILETQLPESVAFISSTPAALSSDDGLVRIALPDVASGANATASVVVRPSQAGSGPAYARVFGAQSDPGLSNNETEALLSAVFAPPATSDLSITQTAPGSPRVGLPATWTITVTNNGPDAAANVSLTDVLPPGAAFVSAVPAPASLTNGRTSFALGTLANGASRTVTVTAEPQFAGEAVNRATASSASMDANGAESVSTVNVLAAPTTSADLSVSLTAASRAAALNADITFTLTLANSGPDAANSVIATLPIPPGLEFVSGTNGATQANGIVTASAASLAPGGNAVFTLVLRAVQGQPYVLAAEISSADNDPAPGNNRAAASVLVNDPAASVAIVQNFAAPEIATLRGWLTDLGYTSQVFDQTGLTAGALRSFKLVIWDDLGSAEGGVGPAEVDIFQAVREAGIPLYFIGDDLARTFTLLSEPHLERWKQLIRLSAYCGDAGDPTFRIFQNPGHPVLTGPYGAVTGTFPLGGDTDCDMGYGDGIGINLMAHCDPVTKIRRVTQNWLPTAAPTPQVQASTIFKNAVAWLMASHIRPDLAVTQTPGRTTVVLGSQVEVEMLLANSGPGAAEDVVLTDELPSGLAYVSSVSDRGTVSFAGNRLTVRAGTMAEGEVIHVTVRMAASAEGIHAHTVSSAACHQDPVPGNNLSSVAISVIPQPPALLRGTYRFEDTLAACEPDAPPLVAIDPANADSFTTAEVNGVMRRVYRWDGSRSAGQTAGLALRSSGIMPADNYSVEMLFRFTEPFAGVRRVVDTTDRSAAGGVSLDAAHHVIAGTGSAGSGIALPQEFHHLVLTVAPGGVAETWLDGIRQSALTGQTGLNIPASGLLHFFAANLTGAGDTDYADGEIALLRVYEGVLPANRIAAQAAYPFGPREPMDVNVQMIAARNPIGVWTGGYSETRGTPFIPSSIVVPLDARWYRWSGTANGPHVYRNRTNSTISHLTIRQPPDLLGMDPSYDGRNAVVRWTAPAGGTYRIQGRWQGIDVSPNGTDVAVLKNGDAATTLFADYVLAFGMAKPFDVTVTLAMGETVDFSLGRGGNSNLFDSTGLDAVITPLMLTDDCADGTDLAVTHTPPGTMPLNEPAALELTVSNNGLRPAPGVVLSSALPAGFTLVSATAEGGTVQQSAGTITASLGTLTPGESRRVSLLVTAANAGTFTHTAQVAGGSFDPLPGNNTSALQFNAGVVIQLTLTARTTVESVTAGSEAVFELVMANGSALPAPGAMLSVPVPPGATFVSASGGGTLQNGSVTFPAVTLAAGQVAGFSLRLRADAPGTLTVNALASSANPSVREADASAAITVLPVFTPPALQVAITTDPAQPFAGCRVTTTYTVTNTSATPANDVMLSGWIPSTLVVISTTASQGSASVAAGRLSATLGTVLQGTPVTVTVVALATAAEATALSAGVSGTSLPTGLKHLWDFNETAGPASSSTVLHDLVSQAHGTVRGSGAVTTGHGVRLPGGDQNIAPYIDLPNGLISPLRQVTFEGWLTVNALGTNWGHIFSFGSSSPGGANGELFGPGNTNGGGEEGLDYISLTTSLFTNDQSQRLAVRNGDPGGAGEWLLDSNSATVVGQPIHIAVAVNNSTPGQTTVRYYRNGVFKGELVNLPFNLSSLNDVNNWLGRGNWTGYPHVASTWDEFRLYDRALDATEIEASRLAGPGVYSASLTTGNAAHTSTASALIRRDTALPPPGSPCAVPVALQIFKASAQQSYRLEWSATPGRKFLIQSSPDLQRWINVPALHTATQTTETWTDPGPPATEIAPSQDPVRYYRVLELAE